jgi:nucleotide-binding universal stress UspA family protein
MRLKQRGMNQFTIKNILVAYESSKHSSNALNTAITIAQQHGARVTLLHVIDSAKGVHVTTNQTVTAPVPQLMRVANENLNVLVKTLSSCHNVSFEHAVVHGVPAFEICKYAWENDFDLLAIGQERKSLIKTFLSDSLYDKLVKNACCPVLSVPSGRLFTQFRKVVFPIRNAPSIVDKYNFVKPIIHRSKASVILAGLTTKSDSDNFRTVSTLTDVMKEKLEKEKIQFSATLHFCDSIPSRLLEIVREELPDLVVISTVVDTGLKPLLLDYYSKVIMHNAPCPVLSVKPEMSAVPN